MTGIRQMPRGRGLTIVSANNNTDGPTRPVPEGVEK
jgi:hypothetical protein